MNLNEMYFYLIIKAFKEWHAGMETASISLRSTTSSIIKDEEVMEVGVFGGIPEDSLEELQAGKDMAFITDVQRKTEKADDDTMWSSSSSQLSDWLFGDE